MFILILHFLNWFGFHQLNVSHHHGKDDDDLVYVGRIRHLTCCLSVWCHIRLQVLDSAAAQE